MWHSATPVPSARGGWYAQAERTAEEAGGAQERRVEDSFSDHYLYGPGSDRPPICDGQRTDAAGHGSAPCTVPEAPAGPLQQAPAPF
jgi:hypothetical protein